MSWTWRKPRVPVQPALGWQAPHELVNDHAARGVEIARLTGILGSLSTHIDRQAESMRRGERVLNAATSELAEATATIKELRGELDRKEDQIQRQANLFEQLRDQMELTKQSLFAERVLCQILTEERDAARSRATELEQTIVALSATTGLDAAWPDVAAVSGPQSKSLGRQ